MVMMFEMWVKQFVGYEWHLTWEQCSRLWDQRRKCSVWGRSLSTVLTGLHPAPTQDSSEEKKKNPSIIYYCTVKITLLFFVVNVEVQEHLHLLLRRRGGPLRGWSASADELWGNTSGPSKSPHQQTCTHPRSPTCDSKMGFIPRCEKNRNKTLCSKVLTYCWMVFGWSKPSILSLMTTAFSWALRALGRHSDTSVIALQLLCKTHIWDKSRAFRNFSLLSLTWLYVLNKMSVLTLEIHVGSTLKILKREVCLQLKILGGNSLKKQL